MKVCIQHSDSYLSVWTRGLSVLKLSQEDGRWRQSDGEIFIVIFILQDRGLNVCV